MEREVSLKTCDVNDEIRISSVDVALDFDKRHKSVIKKIENLTAQNGAVKKMFKVSEYDTGRRKEKCYLLNRDGFSLLVMGFTGEKALNWKIKYINMFNLMEKELKARIETRNIGVNIRKNLTDTIKKCVTDEGNFKKWAYSTYSKLVYKKVLGKTVKKAKLERGLKETDNIRNYLSLEELEKVQELESKIATFIEFTDNSHKTDKEIYNDVKNYLENN